MGYSAKKDTSYDPTAESFGYRYFPPIPDGVYDVVVQEATMSEYQRGSNKGRDMLNLKLKVVGPTSVGRVLFTNIGVFEKWGPTQKNPGGSGNWTFFGFFAAVKGMSEKDFREWFKNTEDPFAELPLPSRIEGMTLTVDVSHSDDTRRQENAQATADSYGTTPEERQEIFDLESNAQRNEVKRFKVYDASSSSKVVASSEAKTAFQL